MPVFIYGLKCPIANTIRYVGKAENPNKRLVNHLANARSGASKHHTGRWLRKLLRNGLMPELIILHCVQPNESWQELECAFIASAKSKGWKLTNSLEGGGAGCNFIDPIARDSWLANVKKANGEINKRPEVRANRTAQLKRNWADPISNAKRLAGLSSEATRAKMTASAKARWTDPVKSAAIRERLSSQERRAKMVEIANRRATPEYRAMIAEKTRLSWIERRRKKNL